MSAVDVLAVPICIARQHQQHTDPRLAHYQVLIHLGTPENYGNCVAVAYGNNSGNAAEQLAFAEKLVRTYNRDDAVAELIEAAKEVVDNEDEPRFIYGSINSLRAALARVGGAQS